jgi:ABC-type multidrug transport system ATPase subunit
LNHSDNTMGLTGNQQPATGNLTASQETDGFVITADRLSKRFNREWIFRDLTFRFDSGNVYAITGPNGSGKSTLLQILWGQMPQTSGKLFYKKGDREIPVEEICNVIAIATPYMDLIDEFTLQEHLTFHFKLRKARGNFTIDQLIAAMYMEDARDKTIGNFSSGMKQRLKLGMAFYTQADIIFLDEPGTNLDQQAFAWYRHELQKTGSKPLILIASNDLEEFPPNSQKISMLDYKK